MKKSINLVVMRYTLWTFSLILFSSCATTTHYEKLNSQDGKTQYRINCKDIDTCYAKAYNEICKGPLIVVHTDIHPQAAGPHAPRTQPEFQVLVECGNRKPRGGEIRLDNSPD